MRLAHKAKMSQMVEVNYRKFLKGTVQQINEHITQRQADEWKTVTCVGR